MNAVPLYYLYSAYQKEVINFQRPIVLKSINLNYCMWHISKEQLIFFPLSSFLSHECHAWPSTLPVKMTMSFSIFCKFCELDKSIIAKQCNGVAAEIVTSYARWLFAFWNFEQGSCNFSLGSWGSFGRIWDELRDVWAMVRQDMQDMLHRCQLCIEIRSGYVEDVVA